MPEVTIHEHSELLLWEGKVRAAGDGIVPPPTCDAVSSEQLGERDFRVLVPLTPDPGHHLGALGLGEDVVPLLLCYSHLLVRFAMCQASASS